MKSLKKLSNICLALLSLILFTCQEETITVEETVGIENGNNPFYKTGSLEDFDNLKEFVNKDVIEYRNSSDVMYRTSTEDSNGFTIINNNIVQMIGDSLTTFTLKIVKDNQEENTFSNLIVNFSDTEPTEAFIINYYPNANYLAEIEQNPQHVFEGEFNMEAIDYDGGLDFLHARISCVTITSSYCNWGGEEHPEGANCTAAYIYDVTQTVCWQTTQYYFEPNDNSITDADGPTSGGGSSNPNYVSICDKSIAQGNSFSNTIDVVDGATAEDCVTLNQIVTDCTYVNELANQINIALNNTLYPAHISFLENNCESSQAIFAYLQNNKDENGVVSEDAQNFATAAIEAFINGDIVDVELEMIIEINETVEFQAQTCLKKIKDEVVKTKQISKIIKKFEPTNPVLHLEWGMFTNTSWGNTGETLLNLNQDTAFINFNSESLTHVSNIVMVKTIAHELIHAELYRKLKELVNDVNIISLAEYNALQDNYLGIADYTFRYGVLDYTQNGLGGLITWGLTPNYSLAHHNQMAAFYRETLINVMKAYDLANGTTRPNADEFYEALSWAGLRIASSENGNSEYTDAWVNFKNAVDISEANLPVSERTYSRFETIISNEYNNTGINCD